MGRPQETYEGIVARPEQPKVDLGTLRLTAAPPYTQSVSIEGIEVTQAVQNLNHDVPLIAGRRTIVRVYFNVTTDQGFGQISGRLLVKSAAGNVIVDPAVQSISVLDQWNGNMDTFKRQNINTSMNFELPSFLTFVGTCTVSVLEVMDMYHDRAEVPCTNQATLTQTVSFVAGAPLRLTVIGLRYTQNMTSFEPSQLDFNLIRSWFIRAYPITDLIYNTRTVAASFTVTGTAASTANTQIAQIRALDISGGTDRRTHYYGLVADGGTFMRGLSQMPTAAPDPSAVGSGPTGASGFAWDTDGSYGDWYTGHEVGHTLGRQHVGGTCSEPGPLDTGFPFPSGQLSGPADGFVGLDVGDAAFNISMQALDGTTWHDVMTYCDFQWASSYTYNAFMTRINAENNLPSSGPGPSANSVGNGAVIVIGLWDTKANSFRVTSVDRVTDTSVGEPSPDLDVVGLSATGQVLSSTKAVVHPPSRDDSHDSLVTAVIPYNDALSRIEFRHNQVVIGAYDHKRAHDAVTGSAVKRAADPHVLEWAADIANAPTLRYHIQVSDNGGFTWDTVAVNQTDKALDLRTLHLPKTGVPLKVKIITTDGFHTHTQVLDVDQVP